MRILLLPWLAAVAASVSGLALAQAPYPAKSVRLIVPYPPGGGTDTMGRMLAQKLTQTLGQQVIVDNRPGGGANIGAELAAKSPADGYTLLMCTIAHATAGSLYRKLGYDVLRDFTPVSLLATTPHILVAHPSMPVKSVKQLIALAKARPNELVYSSSGSGTPAHLAGELFKHMAGVSMVHIPYKGGGPSVIALLSGEVMLAFATTPSVINHVKARRLQPIAVTTARRSVATPDLPTISESGLPGYDVGSWYGLLAPTGTRAEIVARLNDEAHKALHSADVKQRLDASGFEALTSSPQEYGAFLRGEVEKWAKVVKAAGIRAD
ncbi:MAG TPA: tripartite tricarboxylate transporter substrate binding protein [Burkholderiales bacterium]|nr:tripartite tricarboxylate transporter substrate binding protein [Burkholderiales bacterium]